MVAAVGAKNGLSGEMTKALQNYHITGSHDMMREALRKTKAIEGANQISAAYFHVQEVASQYADPLNGLLPLLEQEFPHVYHILKKNSSHKEVYKFLLKTKNVQSHYDRQKACREAIKSYWGDGVEQALHLTETTSRSYCEAIRALARLVDYEVANDAVIVAILERRHQGSRKQVATTIEVRKATQWAKEDPLAMPQPGENLHGFHVGNFEIVSTKQPAPEVYKPNFRISTVEPSTPTGKTPRAAKTAARAAMAETPASARPTSARHTRRSRARRETSEALSTERDSGSREDSAGPVEAGNDSSTPAPPPPAVASIESNSAGAHTSSAVAPAVDDNDAQTITGASRSTSAPFPSGVATAAGDDDTLAATAAARSTSVPPSSVIASVESNSAVAPTSSGVAAIAGDDDAHTAAGASNTAAAATDAAQPTPALAPAAANNSKAASNKRSRRSSAASRRPQKAPRRSESGPGELLRDDEPNSAAEDSEEESEYEPGADAAPAPEDEVMSEHSGEASADDDESDTRWDVRLREKFMARMAVYGGLTNFLAGGANDTTSCNDVVDKLKNPSQDGLFIKSWSARCAASMKAALADTRQEYRDELARGDVMEE